MDFSRLSMPLGEAIFTQRSIRRFLPDPISVEDIKLMVEAAVRAPSGGNQQIARFLVVNEPRAIRKFGPLYRDAWWAKRHDEGFADHAALPSRFHSDNHALPRAGVLHPHHHEVARDHRPSAH